MGCHIVSWSSCVVAGWDLGGNFDRSLEHLWIRTLAVNSTAVGCHNRRRIVAGVVAVGSCLQRGLGWCSRRCRTAALGDHVDTVDRPGRWNRGKIVRDHGLARCRRKVAGKMAEETPGNLAEASDHILAGREKNTGRVEEVAVHTGVPAVHTKAPVLDSSPSWRLDNYNHSCCLQRYCLGVDIVSCLLFQCRGYFSIVLCCWSYQDVSTEVKYRMLMRDHRQAQREKYLVHVPTFPNARAGHVKLRSSSASPIRAHDPSRNSVHCSVVTSTRHPIIICTATRHAAW